MLHDAAVDGLGDRVDVFVIRTSREHGDRQAVRFG